MKQPIHRHFNLTLTVLSDLHIGSGKPPLEEDVDFYCDLPEIKVVDGERAFAEAFAAGKRFKNIANLKLPDFLKPSEVDAYTLYRFQADACPKTIVPCIKTPEMHAYIPGSSLKGAWRTALLAGLVGRHREMLQQVELGPSSRFAAAPLERKIFGYNPQSSLFRAFRLADSAPLSKNTLICRHVALFNLRGGKFERQGQGYEWWMEMIPAGTILPMQLTLDQFALQTPKSAVARGHREAESIVADFGRKSSWFKEMVALCREPMASYLKREIAFYSKHGASEAVEFYRRLDKQFNESDPQREILMQMSWGTGWQTKTLGLLELDVKTIQNWREKYRLGRAGLPFPKTRRLLTKGKSGEPMGWVKITLA
jgi:CRISPR type III-A-associated RAMP protein Csm5